MGIPCVLAKHHVGLGAVLMSQWTFVGKTEHYLDRGFSAKELKAAAVQSLRFLERKVVQQDSSCYQDWRATRHIFPSSQTTHSISVSSASASLISPFSSVSKDNSSSDTSVLVSNALLSSIEYLEAENKSLGNRSQAVEKTPFRVKCIGGDDKLYTGFATYMYSVFVQF